MFQIECPAVKGPLPWPFSYYLSSISRPHDLQPWTQLNEAEIARKGDVSGVPIRTEVSWVRQDRHGLWQ